MAQPGRSLLKSRHLSTFPLRDQLVCVGASRNLKPPFQTFPNLFAQVKRLNQAAHCSKGATFPPFRSKPACVCDALEDFSTQAGDPGKHPTKGKQTGHAAHPNPIDPIFFYVEYSLDGYRPLVLRTANVKSCEAVS
jgi:hypothetical protein